MNLGIEIELKDKNTIVSVPNLGIFYIFVFSMKIYSKSTLREFWTKHKDSELGLKVWYTDAENAEWKTPKHIKTYDGTVSIVANNRAIFNIKGNSYRLIVEINYKCGLIFIRFIGTHKEYDRIDATQI